MNVGRGNEPVAHETQLEKARRQVKDGAARVAKQRQTIERLRRDGFNTDTAEATLATLERVQIGFEDQLTRLERAGGTH